MATILPWEAIRREYVEGQRDGRGGGLVYPTYEQLAHKYACGLSSIATRAGRERWLEQRQQFQEHNGDESSQRATEIAEAARARGISLIDASAQRCAERGIACIEALFERFCENIRDQTQTKRQILNDFVDLEMLSRALRTFQAVGQGVGDVEEANNA